MATPSPAQNEKRVIDKCIALLLDASNSPSATDPVGARTLKSMPRCYVSDGAPSGGTNPANGDLCLDTANNNVYRYDGTDTWDKISV